MQRPHLSEAVDENASGDMTEDDRGAFWYPKGRRSCLISPTVYDFCCVSVCFFAGFYLHTGLWIALLCNGCFRCTCSSLLPSFIPEFLFFVHCILNLGSYSFKFWNSKFFFVWRGAGRGACPAILWPMWQLGLGTLLYTMDEGYICYYEKCGDILHISRYLRDMFEILKD